MKQPCPNVEPTNGWPKVECVNAALLMPVCEKDEPPNVVWLKFIRDAAVLLKLIDE